MNDHNHAHISMVFKSIFTISFFFLLSSLPQSRCQPPPPVSNYYSVCKERSYNCGKLHNISYPFWGHNRPSHCGGGRLFNLNCHNDQNTSTILIASQNFTVVDIIPHSYTMRMKRTDLDRDICSPQFNDTYLIPSVFHHPPSVYNTTITYNCSSFVFSLANNHFSCASQNVIYTVPGEQQPQPPCHGRLVRVPTEAPAQSYAGGGVDALKRVLDEGFQVNYSTVAQECTRCLQSGGVCGTNNDTAQCYCPDGSNALPCPVPVSVPVPVHNRNHNKWNLQTKIIIGSGGALFTGLLICITIFCFKYKSLTWQEKFCLATKSNQDIEAFLKNHGAITVKRYKFSDVKKMTNSFKVKLGQGGFGVVYKGILTGSPVAIKMLNPSKGNGEEFINEVASISKTSHVNVVTLLGFCLEGHKKALIYEFMPNGSLDKFIYTKIPEAIASLSSENLYQIAKGIAQGLEYLHKGCNTRILHFDIKPHNILLDENFCPKISDFGLAKLCPKKESIISMSNARGTMGYVAPEVWNRQFGGVSHKSDVYSYGMMLLEMVGGRKNINGEASHTSEIYFPHWVYNRLELGSDLRLDGVITIEENEITRRMTIVGLWCIQTFPNDRPTMSKVIDMLEGSMDSLQMPPKPLFSSPTRSVPESSTS